MAVERKYEVHGSLLRSRIHHTKVELDPNIEFYKEDDCIYLEFGNRPKGEVVSCTEEVYPGVLIDFRSDGTPCGIDVCAIVKREDVSKEVDTCPTCESFQRKMCVGFCPDAWHGNGPVSNSVLVDKETGEVVWPPEALEVPAQSQECLLGDQLRQYFVDEGIINPNATVTSLELLSTVQQLRELSRLGPCCIDPPEPKATVTHRCGFCFHFLTMINNVPTCTLLGCPANKEVKSVQEPTENHRVPRDPG